MPYIVPESRQEHDTFEKGSTTTCPGVLNYMITRLCLGFLSGTAQKYGNFNDVIGALECAKLELYRRLVAKYEDEKIKTNGDVY